MEQYDIKNVVINYETCSSMIQKIVIVDYGMGNIYSISKKLKGKNIKLLFQMIQM